MAVKKGKGGRWLEILLVTLVLLIVIAIGILVITKPKLVGQDKCIEDYCEGTMFYQCIVQEDGFKAHVLQGEVISKCGVSEESLKARAEAESKAAAPVVPKPQQIKNVVKQQPTIKATKVEKCGNGKVELGEGCGNCPEDVVCPQAFSCINNECKEIGLFRVKGGNYCGYERGLVSRRDERSPLPVIAYHASCEDARGGSTGDKVYDGKKGLGEYTWLCVNNAGLELPQFISMKLDKEQIISRARVIESNLRDDLNVKNVRMEASIDSTDGVDGHWLHLGTAEFIEDNYKGFAEIYTDPVSARWVRIYIDDVWDYPITKFGLAEIEIYEAKYTCDSDYNSRAYHNN